MTAEDFNQGDRVMFTRAWLDQGMRMRDKDKVGTVSGRPQRDRHLLVRVLFDGEKCKHNLHYSFLRKVGKV